MGVPRAASYRELNSSPADEVHANGSRTWWTRSQALVVGYTEAQAGDDLVVDDANGEYVALVLDGAEVSVDHASGVQVVGEPAVVVVPPGYVDDPSRGRRADRSAVRFVDRPGSRRTVCQRRRLRRARRQRGRLHGMAGTRRPAIGSGSIDCRTFPLEEGRLGRILRCTTVMVNVLPERRHAARPDQAVPASSRRLRASVAADPGGLRAPHARAVDTGLVDLARRRTSSLCRAGGGGDPAAAHPHESVGWRDAALADRRVRPTAARLLRNGRVGCSTPTTTRCQRPDVAGRRRSAAVARCSPWP